MSFNIVRNDITKMRVDAIVNTANPRPEIGYGVDSGVHQAAGPQLLEARKQIGKIRVGDAAITPGFQLQCKYVIHSVGPVWRGGFWGEERLLKRCYTRSLKLAKEHDCRSVAFPLISAGNHGFPKDKALKIAMDTIRDFLLENEMQVTLVVFSQDAFRLSGKLFRDVASFIDEHYVQEKNFQQYGVSDKCAVRGAEQELILREQLRRRQTQRYEESWWDIEDGEVYASDDSCKEEVMFGSAKSSPRKEIFDGAPAPRPYGAAKKREARPRKKLSLAELLDQTDAGFSETLLKLIDQTGKKDSEIYTKANVTRQHFSKIRNNRSYKPTKATAIAFAIALELDLEQTRDLIGRAGYALTNSSKFDVIIMYFIGEKNYNLYEINAALFEFDQSLLGV